MAAVVDEALAEEIAGLDAARLGTSWLRERACRGEPVGLFFPAHGDGAAQDAAEAVCASCPVRRQCLADALSRPDRGGVVAGTTERQRRRLKKLLPAGTADL